MNMSTVCGQTEFDREIQSSDLPILVYFWNPLCEHCVRVIDPIICDIAEECPNIMFLRVDGRESNDLVDRFILLSFPTFILFSGGADIAYLDGDVTEKRLLALLRSYR